MRMNKNIGKHVFAWGAKSMLLLVALFIYAHVAYASESAGENIKSETKEAYEVVAIKNNLLYDAAATPNLYLEVRLARRWTLEMGAGFNPFPLSDEKFPKWRHLSVTLAPRYWFCGAFNRGVVQYTTGVQDWSPSGSNYFNM